MGAAGTKRGGVKARFGDVNGTFVRREGGENSKSCEMETLGGGVDIERRWG